MLTAISPLDGRYQSKLTKLQPYFSEFALIKYRTLVEVEYFIRLHESLPNLPALTPLQKDQLRIICSDFSIADAEKIKDIERITNHDVKAVEYFLKSKVIEMGMEGSKEFVHFALTSQDINNTAIPMLIRDFSKDVLIPILEELLRSINEMGIQWKHIPMLSRTHGQAATPTTIGKEFLVFSDRLNKQIRSLIQFEYSGKFGGATGNFNAHVAAYPNIDWTQWADDFLLQMLHLKRQQYTTQIAHYDEIAEWCHILIRINSILLDFCRDIWTYISMEYFRQKTKTGEVGSSAMPHKVNPIDFENAEGNLGLSTAVASHLAEKLPVSRLQRDLTDSTVLRNIGVPSAHLYLAIQSIQKGLEKILLNEEKLLSDLDANWIILAEAIQTILRREGYPEPYEALKELTRGKSNIQKSELWEFIDRLAIPENVKAELKKLNPKEYIGILQN